MKNNELEKHNENEKHNELEKNNEIEKHFENMIFKRKLVAPLLDRHFALAASFQLFGYKAWKEFREASQEIIFYKMMRDKELRHQLRREQLDYKNLWSGNFKAPCLSTFEGNSFADSSFTEKKNLQRRQLQRQQLGRKQFRRQQLRKKTTSKTAASKKAASNRAAWKKTLPSSSLTLTQELELDAILGSNFASLA